MVGRMRIPPASRSLAPVAATAEFPNVLAKPGSGETARLTLSEDDPVMDVVVKYGEHILALPTVSSIAWKPGEKKLYIYAQGAEFRLAADAIIRDEIEGIAVGWRGPEGQTSDDPKAWYNRPRDQAKIASAIMGVHDMAYNIGTKTWNFYTINDAHVGILKGLLSERIGGDLTRVERWLPTEDAIRGSAYANSLAYR